jgi:hypothetical protein
VKSNVRDGWVRAVEPFTSGKHRWHVELITDKMSDECSTMGVCVEAPGNAYVQHAPGPCHTVSHRAIQCAPRVGSRAPNSVAPGFLVPSSCVSVTVYGWAPRCRYNGPGWFVCRAYNGCCYAEGRSVGENAKYHVGTVVTMELDLEEGGECAVYCVLCPAALSCNTCDSWDSRGPNCNGHVFFCSLQIASHITYSTQRPLHVRMLCHL